MTKETTVDILKKKKSSDSSNFFNLLCFVLGLKETAEEMVKNRLEGKDNLTPWQKYLEKKKEKRILKKKRKVMFALATWGGVVVCFS